MTDIADIGAAVARQLRRKGYTSTRNKESGMNAKVLAQLIRDLLAGDPVVDGGQALVDDLTVTRVRSDGHGQNFIVSNPDGDRFRVIVTSP